MTRKDKLKTLYRKLDQLEWCNNLDDKSIVYVRTEISRMQYRNSFGALEDTIFAVLVFTLIPLVVFYNYTMYYGLSNFFSQIKHHYKSLFELVKKELV